MGNMANLVLDSVVVLEMDLEVLETGRPDWSDIDDLGRVAGLV
jgi:hypothetical protein